MLTEREKMRDAKVIFEFDNKKKFQSISDIEVEFTERVLSRIFELDWLYGYSYNEKRGYNWGIPKKSISLWSGESGVGKSRISIEYSKKIVEQGYKVLYIQSEMPLGVFKSQHKIDDEKHKNIYIYDYSYIIDIEKIIYSLRPDITIIDSINEIDEYTETARTAEKIIRGSSNKKTQEYYNGLRKICNDTGTSIILLNQLNQNGSIKGGTKLPHLTDCVFKIEKTDSRHIISMKNTKNRYGKSYVEILWKHYDEGCFSYSENRRDDELWLKSCKWWSNKIKK